MRLPLIITAIAFSAPGVAQIMERNAQASWQSYSSRVVRWNDSLWAFTGNVNYLNSPFSGVITTVIDTTGGLHWEIPMLSPDNEGLYANALAAQNDSTLLLSGWTRQICDAGGDHGFLMALGLVGDSLWARSFGTQPLEHLATPGTAILASSGDHVLVLDQDGDSLDLVPLPLGAVRRLRTDDTLALAACDNGALVLDANAAVVIAHGFASGVDDLVRYNDSNYACISGGWLYLLDSALAPFDSVTYGSVGAGVSLHEDLAYLWVVGGDTARFFDPLLQPAFAFAMAAPAGHVLHDAAVGLDAIMTAGGFADGPITTAVQRSVGKHGETFEALVDPALGELTAEDIVITPGLPGQYGVSVVLRVWLRNEGGEILNAAFLDLLNGSAPCGPMGVLSQTGVGVLPGDSVLAYLGGVSITVVSSDSTPVEVDFCIRVTTPNGFMDRDTSDNYSCGTVTIPIGIAESQARSSLGVFPNPATDQLNITLSPALRQGDYRIIDQLGREVRSGTLDENGIDLSRLSDGAYQLQLRPSGASARFVILH